MSGACSMQIRKAGFQPLTGRNGCLDWKKQLTNVANRFRASHNVIWPDMWTMTPALLANPTLRYRRAFRIQTGQDIRGNRRLDIRVLILFQADTFRFAVAQSGRFPIAAGYPPGA